MKLTKTVILAVVLGFIAMLSGAALRIYFALHAKYTEISKNVTIETEKKETEDYSDLLKERGRFNVLLMGEDDVEGSKRSDTILLLSVNIEEKNIRVLSIPRDTRVPVPRHGIQKLNHAFAFGGVELLKRTIEKYLNEPILYYILVDYNSFPVFVDLLGGVEVDVQKHMRYVDRAGHLNINIQPGKQLLNGEKSLHFVRFRKDVQGDIGRIQRQQQFIKALLKKAYDPRVYIKFPELVSQAMKLFNTDMPFNIAVQLAGFAQKEIGRNRIFFSMLPGEPVMINRLSYWQGDINAAKAFLNASCDMLISGDLVQWHGKKKKQVEFTDARDEIVETDNVGKQCVVKKERTREEIIELIKSMPEAVAVLNGIGKSGISSEISTRLQQLGVDVIHSGNAKHFDYRFSNVVYPTKADENMKKSAMLLGELLQIPKNLIRPSKQAFYASVIVGHDDYSKIISLLDTMLKVINHGESGENKEAAEQDKEE